MSVFELLQPMIGHERKQALQLGKVHTRHGKIGTGRCFFGSLHHFAQISRNSREVVVRISAPRGVTRASSSMRIPPTPSTYTPGSKVTTLPVSRIVFWSRAIRGSS